MDLFKRRLDHAGPGNASVDDDVSFTDPMKATGHKGIISDGITEDNQFGVGHYVLLGDLVNGLAEVGNGVHVDPAAGRTNVD